MFLKPTAEFATNRVPASAWIARWTHLVAPNANTSIAIGGESGAGENADAANAYEVSVALAAQPNEK